MFRPLFVVAAAAGFVLAGCDKSDAVAPTAAKPELSFQEIMQTKIDAPADVFWAASGVVIDAQGEHSLTPKTDAEWQEARDAVVTFIKASDDLTTPGRLLVQPGQKIGDEGLESVASPDWIRRAFVDQRPLLLERAAALKSIGGEALAAIDRRDVKAIDEIGERLDQACEACHETFWYPPSARPARTTPLVLPAKPPPAPLS